jgi:uncharacterized protein (DUF779 family)
MGDRSRTLIDMRVSATERAAAIVDQVRATRHGALTITIGTGCCESTAPFLYEDFWPGPDQEIVGEVAGVPVYAPAYLRAGYPGDDGVVIDVLEDQPAESLSIETALDCRLILRGFGVDLGAEPEVCVLPTEITPSIATGGPSRVRGELPEALRRAHVR